MSLSRHKKRLLFYGLLTVLIMVLIFCLSEQDANKSSSLSHSFLASWLGELLERYLPRLTDQGTDHDIRKYAHMFEYFCLGISGFLFFRELFADGREPLLPAAAASFALAVLYACTDEWHQTFVPGRAGRVTDVLVDAAGCLFGIGLFCLVKGFLLLDKKRKRA